MNGAEYFQASLGKANANYMRIDTETEFIRAEGRFAFGGHTARETTIIKEIFINRKELRDGKKYNITVNDYDGGSNGCV